MTLKEILLSKKNLEKVAIKDSSQCITYKEMYQYVVHYRDVLAIHKVQSQNIGIFLPNSIQYALAYFSIVFLEKTIVPIDVASRCLEVFSTIDYCEVNYIVTNNFYIDILKKHLVDYSHEITIFNIDDCTFSICGQGNKVLMPINLENKFNDDNIAILIHTSGTTSNPKRVMLTHKNLVSNMKSIVDSLELSEESITLIALPMYLASANTSQFLTHLYLGATIIIMDGLFDPLKFFRFVHYENVTNFTGVPTMMYMLQTYYQRNIYDISSLKLICFGGGYTPKQRILDLMESYPNIKFVHMYGQTEATTRITHLLPDDSIRKLGSIGKPIAGINLKLVDESGNDVAPGYIGEIIINGNNVMKGYYKRLDATNECIKDGWLHTGDLGRIDEDGYVYYTGRIKNIIVSGGFNIYPEEIEEILLKHPLVKEAYVTGEEDEWLGEIPIAKVVLNDDTRELKEADLINYCFSKVSIYKIPRNIQIVKTLEKTASGKIKRGNKNE